MLKSSEKLKYIDAIRGIAILAVLVIHCREYVESGALIPSAFSFIINQGPRGVQLFYIASAFTMFFTLTGRVKKENNPTRNFFIRRVFRIAPMYWIAIVYYLWQNGRGPSYWLGDAPGISNMNIAANFLFIHGFNAYWINSLVPGGWSIAVEMSFYCLVPFLFSKIKNSLHAINFFFITMIINFIAGYLLHTHQLIADALLWKNFLTLYLPYQMPVFALGILFYFLVKGDYASLRFSWVTFVLCLIMFAVKFFTAMPLITSHLLFAMSFVIMGFVMSKKEFKIVVNPVVRYIGKVSYSMYLVHFAVLYFMVKWNFANYITETTATSALLNYGIRLILLIIISAAISTVFYNLIEVPAQKVGKNIIDRLEKKKAVVSVS
ncbi:MAG: acyltransferase [Bacteroidia bacterium]